MRKLLVSILLAFSLITFPPFTGTSAYNLLFAQPNEATQTQDILAKRGCCSHHDGVCGCENGRTLCCDGTLSPSCTCHSSSENRQTPTPNQDIVHSSQLPIAVSFSPGGQCTEAIVKEINKAHVSILVQAYKFTSSPIAKAFVEAKKRGVNVQAILDKSNRTDKYSSADFLLHADIPTKIDSAHAIAHNKIIIIDGETVITGSFNFTKAAEEHNAENLLVIHDKGLAAKYTENWKAHEKHSEVYGGKNR